MPYFVVRQGDHLERIAYRVGATPEAIWGAPENAKLKELRGAGHILCPGDLVFVPKLREAGEVPLAVGSTNRFKAKAPKTEVVLTLRSSGKPLANEPFRVVEAPAITGTTSGDGELRFEVSVALRRVRVVLTRLGMEIPLDVGGLDPLHEVTGLQMRLEHLGHYHGGVDGRLGPATRAAVKAFQKQRGLLPSGVPDAATLAALREAYGS